MAVVVSATEGRAMAFRPKSGRVLRDWRIAHMFPTSPGVATCVSTTQCTAVGSIAREATFDPTRGAVISNAQMGDNGGYTAVACPSRRQCTALLGEAGWVMTFDPVTGTSAKPTLLTSYYLNGLSCVSTVQCTAVGDVGVEYTFDPVTGQVNSAGTAFVETGKALYGVSCPASDQCTAVDSRGHEVTFDPTTGTVNGAGIQKTGTGKNGSRVDCPTVHQCTVVGSNGKEATFSPASPGEVVAHSIYP